jgi:hypothetical protein
VIPTLLPVSWEPGPHRHYQRQVVKNFTSSPSSASSGGGSQTHLISLAMAEATKLFDKSGGTAEGGKQDAVNGAAMTVMKLFVQSNFSGGAKTTGAGDSGGLGGLLSLVSRFMTPMTIRIRFTHHP